MSHLIDILEFYKVEIGLLYDLPWAKSVTTEPLTSDDWEIIVRACSPLDADTKSKGQEIHASHVESTLLSQVRVVKIGQELDVWVMGRTRVRLRVSRSSVSLHFAISSHKCVSARMDPESLDNALLLTTNTEVSITPKLHLVQQTADGVLNERASSKSARTTGSDKTVRFTSEAQVLRVLPTRFACTPLPGYQGLELVAYVSPITFSELHPSSKGKSTVYLQTTIKRLVPPQEPSRQSSSLSPGQATAPISPASKPGAHDKKPGHENGEKSHIFIAPVANLPQGHILFPATPYEIEDWDIVM